HSACRPALNAPDPIAGTSVDELVIEDGLVGVFLEHANREARSRLHGDARFRRSLAALIREAPCAWPRLRVPREAFVQFLAERAPENGDLSGMPAVDLYLACGCSLGLPTALAAFDERLMPEVEVALARFGFDFYQLQEVKQLLRERLFLHAPE